MRALDDRLNLSAAITVLMAVAVLVMAWGSDRTSSARAAVGGATGPLVADSLGGGAVMDAGNMAPGDSVTGEITVTNVGDVAGDMVLGTSGLTDATTYGGILSQTLRLNVLDVTPGRAPAVVFDGRLTELHVAQLGSFEQADTHRYRFTVTYPAGLGNAADNSLQGASARLSFVWNATGKSAGSGGGVPTAVEVVPDSATPVLVDNVPASTNPGALKLRVYVRRVQAAHRKRVYVNVYCSHRCTLTATGVVSLPSQGRKWKAKTLRGSVERAGTVKFNMALPKKALPLLSRALAHRKKASVKLKITARSGTQTLYWTRTVRLAR